MRASLLSLLLLQVLIDAVVHAVNEDYSGMAQDFIKLGFLQPGVCVFVYVCVCLCMCAHIHLCV